MHSLKIKAAKPLGITKIYALICYSKKSQFEFHSGWGAQAQQAEKTVLAGHAEKECTQFVASGTDRIKLREAARSLLAGRCRA